MRCRLQSSPVFVATLIAGADSVGVACAYQTFIVEKKSTLKTTHQLGDLSPHGLSLLSLKVLFQRLILWRRKFRVIFNKIFCCITREFQ